MATVAPLIAIVGPTASGKTAMAIELAKRFDGEIICADSRTVYKGMDIGTAKPTFDEQATVPHHMLNLVEPNERYTVADFQQGVRKLIDDITARGKFAMLVGGSGLYVDSVIFDYEFGSDRDPIQRARLNELSVAELQNICLENNITLPENSQNKRHLIRVVETTRPLHKRHRVQRLNTLVRLTVVVLLGVDESAHSAI